MFTDLDERFIAETTELRKSDDELRKSDDELRKSDDELRKSDDGLRKSDEVTAGQISLLLLCSMKRKFFLN